MADAILQVQEVHRSFGGVKALNGVSLEVRQGERRAVIGPNGAGKSTLFRVISGELRPTRGAVYFQRREITGRSPEAIAGLGVSRTFQHSHVFPDLSVRENVGLAVLAQRRGRWNAWRPLVDFAGVMSEVDQALEAVGLAGKRLTPASELSHGERRQLEIAMALAQRPRVLLLDEPVAGLAGTERRQMIALLERLPRDITVLIIEHDLDFVLAMADRVTVLHYGEVIAEGEPKDVRDNPKVQEVYIGDQSGRAEAARRAAANGAAGAPVLAVAGLQVRYGDALAVEDVTLEVRRGELVALLGRNGMGKTTTLHAIAGFVKPAGGRVMLEGRDVTGWSPLALARADLALVPQGRRMFPEMTVDEQLTLGARPGKWTPARIYELFPNLAQRRGVLGTSLSGGEQQMLAIGRALLRNPRVLLLDEPSEGLSPLLVRVIRDVIAGLRDAGETILLAEQNVNMALSVADRVYILERGRVVFGGTVEELRSHKDLLQQTLGV